jgi:hypothetical protein
MESFHEARRAVRHRAVDGLFGIVLMMLLQPVWGDEAESPSPHHMVKPDGEPDSDKCLLCHNDDLSLSHTKAETCALCHAANTHAGIAQHVAADPALVARRTQQKEPALPLAEDGKIYCGTCHVFHDPAVSEEPILARQWFPPNTGLAQAVRRSLEERWIQTPRAEGSAAAPATFTSRGTTRLRLPIDDGSLCRHCHDYAK